MLTQPADDMRSDLRVVSLILVILAVGNLPACGGNGTNTEETGSSSHDLDPSVRQGKLNVRLSDLHDNLGSQETHALFLGTPTQEAIARLRSKLLTLHSQIAGVGLSEDPSSEAKRRAHSQLDRLEPNVERLEGWSGEFFERIRRSSGPLTSAMSEIRALAEAVGLLQSHGADVVEEIIRAREATRKFEEGRRYFTGELAKALVGKGSDTELVLLGTGTMIQAAAEISDARKRLTLARNDVLRLDNLMRRARSRSDWIQRTMQSVPENDTFRESADADVGGWSDRLAELGRDAVRLQSQVLDQSPERRAATLRLEKRLGAYFESAGKTFLPVARRLGLPLN